MEDRLRLLCVLAHPDDESLGMGGTLATYAARGVETYLVTATRGERGRFGDNGERPGMEIVGKAREAELRAAAEVLGIREVHFLDYRDGELDQADPEEAIEKIAAHLRRIRPQVVVTFAPDGAYGHPDHIAISQFTSAAAARAAQPRNNGPAALPGHTVSKLYHMAWTREKWDVYQSAFKKLVSRVDGFERHAVPWPEWAITTRIDTASQWQTVWKAVCCHRSQMAIYGKLEHLSPENHEALWGSQEFYRVYSLVNGGRRLERDLFEGLDDSIPAEKETIPRESENAGGAPGSREPARARGRSSPLEIEPGQFRKIGHELVDRISDFLGSFPDRKVTRAESPETIRGVLGAPGPLPETGQDPRRLLEWITPRMFDHSLHNGHPRFWGYITSSAAPIGMLGDFLASSVNPNVGGWELSPLASEIEGETVRWIAGLLGYPDTCGGLFVSGGNMANFLGFLAGRKARSSPDVREEGLARADGRRLLVYTSEETHTWIQKAADLFGLGTRSIRWIPVTRRRTICTKTLRERIEDDLRQGHSPFLVVGTAGSVSTGAVDPLDELAGICEEYNLWFHVDGAYGGFAAAVPACREAFRGLERADSVAVDPHKWLYAPLEAGCTLVRDATLLRDAFSFHPPYYQFSEEVTNYFDYGMQNSRGFRALKVWLSLRQAGRQGYVRMISEDIRLAEELYRLIGSYATLEAATTGLSITTFRYVPEDLLDRRRDSRVEEYLNVLNKDLLGRIEESGEAFLSNAVVDGKFLLRLCIVNFRTSREDIEALPELVVRLGRQADSELRNQGDAGILPVKPNKR